MENLTEDQIQKGLDEAYKKAGSNAYFGNGFKAGIKFALKILNGDTEKRESKLFCYTCNCTEGTNAKGNNYCSMCDHYF